MSWNSLKCLSVLWLLLDVGGLTPRDGATVLASKDNDERGRGRARELIITQVLIDVPNGKNVDDNHSHNPLVTRG